MPCILDTKSSNEAEPKENGDCSHDDYESSNLTNGKTHVSDTNFNGDSMKSDDDEEATNTSNKSADSKESKDKSEPTGVKDAADSKDAKDSQDGRNVNKFLLCYLNSVSFKYFCFRLSPDSIKCVTYYSLLSENTTQTRCLPVFYMLTCWI